MELKLRLEGTAALVHIHAPTPNVGQPKDEYYAKIRADNGSIYGRERPLIYNLPLFREQYEFLEEQMTLHERPNLSVECYKKLPCIEVKCDIQLTPEKGITY